jgi:hypothetical protein
MPTYSFINKETNELEEHMMRISEYDAFKELNPHLERYIDGAPATVSGVSITGKVPDGFKEVLSKVSENHKQSSVADKHGRKSIKEVQTQRLVDKHLGKF